MRRIYLSKVGIHFETERGQINAHWAGFFGISDYDLTYNKKITFNSKSLFYIKRFWQSVIEGIRFLTTNKFGYEIK